MHAFIHPRNGGQVAVTRTGVLLSVHSPHFPLSVDACMHTHPTFTIGPHLFVVAFRQHMTDTHSGDMWEDGGPAEAESHSQDQTEL